MKPKCRTRRPGPAAISFLLAPVLLLPSMLQGEDARASHPDAASVRGGTSLQRLFRYADPEAGPESPARQSPVPGSTATGATPVGSPPPQSGGTADVALAEAAPPVAGNADEYTLVGWNDLGMHCTDGSDFSVFSILPHYNTIHAHLIGKDGLIRNPAGTGITVTYEAVMDPAGSVNRTSAGKGNFYDYVEPLFGAALEPDQGLAGYAMPGPANLRQEMHFSPDFNWFTAEGIPLTPYDDAGRKNYYPMMRLRALNRRGQELAQTDIVLPVSDEMDCRVCHGSWTGPAARPSQGWAKHPDPAKDYKLNILRLHDDRHLGTPVYQEALQAAGYSSAGLFATATDAQTPVLCARCHGSNALPGTGLPGISMLTSAIHGYHAHVIDRTTRLPLNDADNRGACYRCHPGAETRCLRGAMGAAVAPDGTMAMQCQSCHGTMSTVGNAARVGWLEQPNCQACHTGTAVRNSGEIRFESAYDDAGELRVPADDRFATQPDTPAPGVSLFRFSRGHGGLQCEACHGSTHAIFPSTHENDNLQNLRLQGHAGTLSDCTACHTEMPETFDGGPHGMHPIGDYWVDKHRDAAERNTAGCRDCHGLDYRGTVLSRTLGPRSLRTEWGTKTFFQGATIGCYTCHRGPFNDSRNRNQPPVVSGAELTSISGRKARVVLAARDPEGNPLELRIVSQPAHGTVALIDNRAYYRSEPGYVGPDVFTFAAWDGSIDSALAEVHVDVTPKTVAVTEMTTSTTDGLVLSIRPTDAGLVVSWPVASGVVLESAPVLEDPTAWEVLAEPVRVVEGRSLMSVPATAGQRFFRLSRSGNTR
ncbi:MAG: Ig-like domain-containing protein [Verrucomicrobiales bacterium]|nr:Ig-like domain-containing protein [Verrucomicrobiales bacterium]